MDKTAEWDMVCWWGQVVFKVKETYYNPDDSDDTRYCKLISDYLITDPPLKDRETTILKNIESNIFDPYNNRKLKIHSLPSDINQIIPPTPLYK